MIAKLIITLLCLILAVLVIGGIIHAATNKDERKD
jgi:hypothetical protein